MMQEVDTPSKLAGLVPLALVLSVLFLPTVTAFVFGGPFGAPSYIRLADEVILAYMAGMVVISVLIFRRIRKQAFLGFVFFLLFFIWAIILIFRNGLPLSHVLQVILSGKAFIFYAYFSQLSAREKSGYINKLDLVLPMIFFGALIFALIQVFFPSVGEALYGYAFEKRGVFGIGVSSFFQSRVSYANFIIIFFVYCLTFRKKTRTYGYTRFELLVIILSWLSMLLSGTRKELFFLTLLTLYFTWKESKGARLPVTVVVITGLAALSIPVIESFAEKNSIAFSDRYVRAVIAEHALSIAQDYFPAGSGPGTFGSTMSMGYTAIYDQYSVGKNVIGYDGERGPIYDLFLFSMLAEYGVGLFIFAFFLKALNSEGQPSAHPKEGFRRQWGVHAFIFFLVAQSVMTPVMTNAAGLLVFSLIAASYRLYELDVAWLRQQT